MSLHRLKIYVQVAEENAKNDFEILVTNENIMLSYRELDLILNKVEKLNDASEHHALIVRARAVLRKYGKILLEAEPK